MASELVERMRDYNEGRNWPLLSAAARRIEELEAREKALREALGWIAEWDATTDSWYHHHQRVQNVARAALEGKSVEDAKYKPLGDE